MEASPAYKAAQLGDAVREPSGSRMTDTPSTSSPAQQAPLPQAGLLQLPIQCPPWGHLASLSNPGLGGPHPKALLAQILLRSNRNTNEN